MKFSFKSFLLERKRDEVENILKKSKSGYVDSDKELLTNIIKATGGTDEDVGNTVAGLYQVIKRAGLNWSAGMKPKIEIIVKVLNSNRLPGINLNSAKWIDKYLADPKFALDKNDNEFESLFKAAEHVLEAKEAGTKPEILAKLKAAPDALIPARWKGAPVEILPEDKMVALVDTNYKGDNWKVYHLTQKQTDKFAPYWNKDENGKPTEESACGWCTATDYGNGSQWGAWNNEKQTTVTFYKKNVATIQATYNFDSGTWVSIKKPGNDDYNQKEFLEMVGSDEFAPLMKKLLKGRKKVRHFMVKGVMCKYTTEGEGADKILVFDELKLSGLGLTDLSEDLPWVKMTLEEFEAYDKQFDMEDED